MVNNYTICSQRSRYTYDFVSAHLVGFAPGAHDEGVIESHDGNDIDTLCTELGQVLNVSGHVVDRTGWGEST